MTVSFTPNGWDNYLYWIANDPIVLEKINGLIAEIRRHPFQGTGKPEPLSGNLKGYWSRRITGEHRIVYRVSGAKPNQILTIVQARFHYDDRN
jgi:toxin YoeB